MKLDILLKGIEYHLQQGSPENCEITGLCEDSRKIKCGNLFFCRTGTHTSGKRYLRQALSLGAAAVICSKAVMIQWVFKPLQSKTFNRFTGCEKRNIFSELTVFSNNIAIFHKTDVILSICQDHIDTLLSAISQKSHVSNKMI